MRNEKWWLDYIDRSLLDSDEFDRFVNNLEFIEIDQQKRKYVKSAITKCVHLSGGQ